MSAIFAFLLTSVVSLPSYAVASVNVQTGEIFSAAAQRTDAAMRQFYQPAADCFSEAFVFVTLRLARPLTDTDAVLHAFLKMDHPQFDSLLLPAELAAGATDATDADTLSGAGHLRQLHAKAPMSAILASIQYPVQRGRYAAAQRRLNLTKEQYRSELSAQDNIRLMSISAALQLLDGNYTVAAERLGELIAALKEVYGPEHPLPIDITEFLADICVSNQPELALEIWFDEVIAYRIRHNDPSVHYALYLKGLYYMAQEAPAAAEPLLEQAILTLIGTTDAPQPDALAEPETAAETKTETPAEADKQQPQSIQQLLAGRPASGQLLSYINALADALYDQHEYARALPYLEYSAAANAENGQITSDAALDPLERLSYALATTGDFPRAESLLLLNIERIENLPESSSVAEADTVFTAKIRLMDQLAYLYREAGRFPEAISLLHKVLEQERGFRGHQHIDTAITLNRIGQSYSAMDDYEAAISYYKQALEVSTRNLPRYRSYHIDILDNLDTDYKQMQRWQEAAQTAQLALEQSVDLLGEYNVDHISRWQDLSGTYLALSRDTEALEALQNALRQAQALFPEGSHATADTLHLIGQFHFWRSEYPAALPWFEQADALFKQLVAEEHHDALLTTAYLGYLRYALGQTQEALALLERANTLAEQHYTPESNVRVNAQYNFASILLQEGQPARSLPYFRQVLQQIDANPEDRDAYPNLRDVLQDIADNARALGLDDEAQASEVRIALIMADISDDGREIATPAAAPATTPTGSTSPQPLPTLAKPPAAATQGTPPIETTPPPQPPTLPAAGASETDLPSTNAPSGDVPEPSTPATIAPAADAPAAP